MPPEWLEFCVLLDKVDSSMEGGLMVIARPIRCGTPRASRERAERLLVIAIIGMIGFLNYAVVIVAIIAGITFVQRIITTSNGIKD